MYFLIIKKIIKKYKVRHIGSILRNTYLIEACLEKSDLEEAFLIDTNLTNANLIDANLKNATLIRVNLTGAILENAILLNANLTNSNLTNANLTYTDLTKANLTGADLTGADLTGADLTDLDLTDLILENTIFGSNTYNDCTKFPDNFNLNNIKPHPSRTKPILTKNNSKNINESEYNISKSYAELEEEELIESTTKGKIKKMREANKKGNINEKTRIAKTVGIPLNNTSKKGNDIMWYSPKDGQFKKGKLGSLVNNRPNVPARYKINDAGITQSPIAKTTLRKNNKNIEKI